MGKVPKQSSGPSEVLLIICGCILYPNTQPKRGKLSALYSSPPAPTVNTNSDTDHNTTDKTEEHPTQARVTIHKRTDRGKHVAREHGLRRRS
ncbi:hypothetical protein CRG98_010636 [Punica granatum]|uniref:Uncharacterized protein n=1 Tax=Punica granatum TaxID=22663 RepID=A0A2I0KMB8_PUNGR|nr:hypothetical protein CRG98_010636 [Punica granatum]